MLDPFTLLGKLSIAVFVICGYFIVFLVQVTWYLVNLHPEKVGDAFGYLGRGVIDAMANVFRR